LQRILFKVFNYIYLDLANAVCWQPSGGLVAYFQNSSTGEKVNDNSLKPGVLFAEKNCLRHGEFYLKQEQDEKISAKILKWNMDQPLLLVYLE
jgi:hypothetical protein